ncbi:outer membrane beta-barrel protein [Roseomonas frigidaquae]|uniref:Outer membrane beta-barrel protein n=1 Tax=Falsiroseomonas frigidaquae TaxID=487318 RepID=A0ABX1EWA9_9PROT|nr:outer membrane beta-barrel protein [Falsiroseomonas frigidaquae]NKE44134.1 outer membrane beta-barrel protein [Falsiroseomonas frigidaquae]
MSAGAVQPPGFLPGDAPPPAAGRRAGAGRNAVRAAALISAGAAALAAPPAAAQLGNAPDVARGITVQTRPRPAFDPLGVRLPGFRLDAGIDLGAGYDDNTAGTGRNTNASGFLEEQISLSLNSTYTRHALGLSATQTSRKYIGDDDYSWNDYGVLAFGRYDIGRASSVRVEYSRVRSHIDVTSFEVQQGSLTEPLRFDQEAFRASGVAAFNRVNVTGAVESRSFRFQEQDDPGFRGGNAAANDYSRLSGELGASYVIVPGRSVSLTSRLSEITYDRADQRGRDSTTWEILAGAQYDLTALAYASVNLGYRRREFNDPTIPSISGPAFEGRLVLLPSQLVTLTFGVQRSIEESLRGSNVSYVLTSGRVQADYELRRNIILSAELRADRLEYRDPDQVATQGVGTLSARFLLNRNASIVASYRHARSLDAPAGFQEFDRNVFQIRLSLAI